MNILLVFKAEPDLSMLAEKDWRAATENPLGPDISRVRALPGVDEQAGAELLLRARDTHSDLHLTALSVGDERAVHGLRQFAAVGFSEMVLMESCDDLRFSPARVAAYIAQWLRHNPRQLIVLGSQSGEGQNGQTGWLLAEMLGWPCLAGVSDFTLQDDTAWVTQEDGERQSCWAVRLPAIVIVRNKGQISLRIPGIRQRLAAANAQITRITPPDNAVLSPLMCRQFSRNEHRREGVIINGRDTAESVRRLWEEYLQQRMA